MVAGADEFLPLEDPFFHEVKEKLLLLLSVQNSIIFLKKTHIPFILISLH